MRMVLSWGYFAAVFPLFPGCSSLWLIMAARMVPEPRRAVSTLALTLRSFGSESPKNACNTLVANLMAFRLSRCRNGP